MRKDAETVEWQKKIAIDFIKREKAATSRPIHPRVLALRAADYSGASVNEIEKWARQAGVL